MCESVAPHGSSDFYERIMLDGNDKLLHFVFHAP